MSHDSYISGLSRRSLLQAGALLIATPGTLLSAVGARAQSTTPKKGGHLVMALSSASSSDHLDPASYTEAYMYNVGFQVFNTLLELGPDGRVVPSLVESWEASNNDASQWVFKLRKGVAFHNGKELTVKDVIYSLNHHRGDDSKSGGKAALAPITEIKEVNPHEFSVVLSAGNVDFPASFLDVHIGITAEGEDFDKGIGTGAFVLEDFQPGIRALTRRNPNYWDPDRANVESVETLAVQDSSAQVAALLSGKVHVIDEILPQTLPLLEKRQDIVVYRTPENLMNCFVMRTDAEPYTNNDLRLALKYAVDREELHKSFLSGTGTIGNDHPIPSWDPFFSKEVPQRVYDPEKAAYHYKKSGFSGPLPLSVSDNGFTGSADAAQLFQASAAKAGIDIVVERDPS
ncbi:MAG: ABC transporter substrate-binding protein, partial [Methylobacteriaceae bacterium]|nr:ABC transporter substrate-binding protein [Methylobacteriaceae bacterium]